LILGVLLIMAKVKDNLLVQLSAKRQPFFGEVMLCFKLSLDFLLEAMGI